jgi:dTDP-4-dehydrorhamnose 3,5-epimerase-like enzyme
MKTDFEFEDDRGSLSQLVNEGWKQVNYITSKAGAIRGNHTYSSKNIDTSFPAEKLREFNKEKMKKLKESLSAEDKVIDGKEEIKYVFTFGSQDKEIEEETQEMNEE